MKVKFIFRTNAACSYYYESAFSIYSQLCQTFNMTNEMKYKLFDWLTKHHTYDEVLNIYTFNDMFVGNVYVGDFDK